MISKAAQWCALILATSTSAPAASTAVHNRAPLHANVFYPLPLTSVKPSGWLRQQLRIQANGLSGHLDEFWPDLGPNSGWLGGSGESWERGPYFLDGLVPLAYLLNDSRLIAKVEKWMNWTLENQGADGSIGPAKNKDWWPNMLMLKALTQYYEATGDERVIPLMKRYFSYQASRLAAQPLEKWAVHRWHDELISVLWLYNRTGDPALLDLARTLHAQGFDWRKHFANFLYREKVSKAQATLDTHVVNNAMALKSSAEWFLISGNPADREAVYHQLDQMDRYHLLPNGVHSGDEHYAGLNPSQGTELCAVVEAMYSFEEMIAILGDAGFGDRLEKIAFNALPGTFSSDMWAHQYDQQPNQVLCNIQPREWTTNKEDSNLFGLEPNFGCCTSNMHQGWPKLAAHLWMASPGGLAAVAYAPSEVDAALDNGTRIRIAEETEYPFRDRIRITVTPARPAAFALQFRIPTWAEGASISVNGEQRSGIVPGTFYSVNRTWKQGDRVELRFPMKTRITRWYNQSVAFERGPLVYSLRIGEDWRKLREHGPAADWEVHPTTAWNYGLIVDPADPDRSVEVLERKLGESPFSPRGAPVEVRVKGRKVHQWGIEKGSAAPPPTSPVTSRGAVETLTLIPYGAAKLRITAFPLLTDPTPQ